ncbi:MAG: energy-coupling factor ABC transporter ATP-binding protein [Candidatus Methanofastidiosia archaeon]
MYNIVRSRGDDALKLIEVHDVSYKYEEAKNFAIENICLFVKKGECIAIVGENGSGKTTLVKHINGLLKPTSGRVIISGKDTKKRTIAELAKKVGYVFQNPDHMIFADTVKEEIAFGPINLGFSKEYVEDKIDEVLKLTRLENYRDNHPMSLSGGEKQRLALASIIVSEPDILILDEPTTGLDYNSIKSMVKLLRKLKKEEKTIILVTHEMNLVTKFSERVILLKNGRIIADGNVKDIFSNEELLSSTYLETPPIIQLSKLLDKGICLTPVELYKKILGEKA